MIKIGNQTIAGGIPALKTINGESLVGIGDLELATNGKFYQCDVNESLFKSDLPEGYYIEILYEEHRINTKMIEALAFKKNGNNIESLPVDITVDGSGKVILHFSTKWVGYILLKTSTAGSFSNPEVIFPEIIPSASTVFDKIIRTQEEFDDWAANLPQDGLETNRVVTALIDKGSPYINLGWPLTVHGQHYIYGFGRPRIQQADPTMPIFNCFSPIEPVVEQPCIHLYNLELVGATAEWNAPVFVGLGHNKLYNVGIKALPNGTAPIANCRFAVGVYATHDSVGDIWNSNNTNCSVLSNQTNEDGTIPGTGNGVTGLLFSVYPGVINPNISQSQIISWFKTYSHIIIMSGGYGYDVSETFIISNSPLLIRDDVAQAANSTVNKDGYFATIKNGGATETTYVRIQNNTNQNMPISRIWGIK